MHGLIRPLLNLSSSARQSLVSFMLSPVCDFLDYITNLKTTPYPPACQFWFPFGVPLSIKPYKYEATIQARQATVGCSSVAAG